MSKEPWRKPEVKEISAGSAEALKKGLADGGKAPNNLS